MLSQSSLSCMRRARLPPSAKSKWYCTRFISSSSTKMHHYMVWASDYTDEGILARRIAVRPRHMLGANELITQGVIKVAGGLLTPESQHAEPQDRKFVGSALIYEAESLKDVRRIVEADLHWKEGVWDKAKLVILPMVMATTLQERAGITQPTPKYEDRR